MAESLSHAMLDSARVRGKDIARGMFPTTIATTISTAISDDYIDISTAISTTIATTVATTISTTISTAISDDYIDTSTAISTTISIYLRLYRRLYRYIDGYIDDYSYDHNDDYNDEYIEKSEESFLVSMGGVDVGPSFGAGGCNKRRKDYSPTSGVRPTTPAANSAQTMRDKKIRLVESCGSCGHRN